MNEFIRTITATEPAIRSRSFHEIAEGMSTPDLMRCCAELDVFRRDTENLYERVRAACFLHSAYRFHLMESSDVQDTGLIPFQGFEHLLERRFEEAVSEFQLSLDKDGANSAAFSAMAASYHQLTFQILADQVRRSVRATRGNQWMFRVAHPDDHSIRIRRELLRRPEGMPLYPILRETTPVRLDLSHSGWSDIFFLGMDYPEGARVLNISVDLGVYGRDENITPPIETCIRVIPEPVIRLTSIDLGATKDVSDLKDLFNFGNDYLSLLKAGIIASGVIPPSFEGTDQPLSQILSRVAGPGLGIELVTSVNDIPKGSRLAVSTNLLASIISILMRATGQAASLAGPLDERERRLVATRAILGEWLGGSGGGWQDSGGIWPGLKLIEGAFAGEEDPEFGISSGRLLPRHTLLGSDSVHPEIDKRLSESLVLIHGGLAQNVGPILEMVTQRYLLRKQPEWDARQELRTIFDGILSSLKDGDIKALARHTMQNWEGPLKCIIPWVTNAFTETIISKAQDRLGKDFWGFLMLGGMSGGGMAMFVDPARQASFRDEILQIMQDAKRRLETALPFAIDPLVYNFRINPNGSMSELLEGSSALMHLRYYGIHLPLLARSSREDLTSTRRMEFDCFASRCQAQDDTFILLQTVVSTLFRAPDSHWQHNRQEWEDEFAQIKRDNGFDTVQHEQIRADLRSGRIGLSRNRLPAETDIKDVSDDDIQTLEACGSYAQAGLEAIREGRVAVMSLAAGVGSRWTGGAGVIKAINPFVQMAGRHRSFLEIHLAKTRRIANVHQVNLPHIISTSFLTSQPVNDYLNSRQNCGYDGPVYLSPGRSISQRLIPMVRDLVFLWEDLPQAVLDEQKQKVREAGRQALMDWARSKGEGSDYVDNLPAQCLTPPGHWYEVPNLLRNGVLADILKHHPDLQTLMLHNIDTLGADVDPLVLGWHLESGNALTFEVTPRRIDDRGGGLAQVNGRIRLLEGLAQPREDVELRLRYYNSNTTWIQIDSLLDLFGLTREDLYGPQERITDAVRKLAQRLPTYVTIKDVKYRWGHGQEDVYPVTQFEKLWSDMSGLLDVSTGYLAVSRSRGQQLKDPAELDPWVTDGSREQVASLCDFV